MKNFLLLILITVIASCSRNDDPAPTPTPQPNTNTFQQDARLLGTWMADSLWDSTTAQVYLKKGLQEIGDSVIFSGASNNGSTPNTEIKAWYITGPSTLMLPELYFWETNSDSLYVFVGNHTNNQNGYSFGYTLNGSQLIIKYRGISFGTPYYKISYYHKN